jgi:putative endonuclease
VAALPGAAPPRAGTPGAAADPRHEFGRRGEDAAAAWLARQGCEVVARNVRTAFGEIDLVALDGDVVVFVEVKARRGQGALEAVGPAKQRRLVRLATAFLARAGWLERKARFDVVAVDGRGACTHVANAFDCAS